MKISYISERYTANYTPRRGRAAFSHRLRPSGRYVQVYVRDISDAVCVHAIASTVALCLFLRWCTAPGGGDDLRRGFIRLVLTPAIIG
jgi:hypothetical protein